MASTYTSDEYELVIPFLEDLLQHPKLLEFKKHPNWFYYKYGLLAVVGIYLMFGYGAQLLCNIIGFVYPAFCSIKALESTKKEDDTKWLTYWVVFAVFSVCEFFSDLLLSWFPFYWLAKCLFLAWCFLPVAWNGSDLIYGRIVRPFFLKNQNQIDSAMNKVTGHLDDLASKVEKTGANTFKLD